MCSNSHSTVILENRMLHLTWMTYKKTHKVERGKVYAKRTLTRMPSNVENSILHTGIHVFIRVEDVSKHHERQWENKTELVDQTLS